MSAGDEPVAVPAKGFDPESLQPVIRPFLWLWPSGKLGWVAFIGGMCLLAYGLVYSLLQMQSGPLLVAGIGALIASFGFPNPMATTLDKAAGGDIAPDSWNVNPKPPMDIDDWHLDRFIYDEKKDDWSVNYLARYEQDGPRVEVDKEGEDWIVKITGKEPQKVATAAEADEIMREAVKDADDEDAQELIFAEHPRNTRFRALYNSTPPIITSMFVFQAIAVLLLFSMWLPVPTESRDNSMPFIAILLSVGFLTVTVNFFRKKSAMQAWDTVTSIVKYLDAGHNELVGQIRPANFEPLDVFSVDDYRNKSWAFNDLVAWHWEYSVHLRVKERYYDSAEKKWKTRFVYRWKTVRTEGKTREFLLHDGSGGVEIDLETFRDVEWGAPLWIRNKAGSKPGNPLYSPESNEKVMEHRWVLNGLKIGEPVYVMARIRNKTGKDELRGMVSENATRLHHNLVAVGEDAPRRKALIRKGTELSVLQPHRSSVEMFGPGILLALTQLVILMMVV